MLWRPRQMRLIGQLRPSLVQQVTSQREGMLGDSLPAQRVTQAEMKRMRSGSQLF